MSLPDRQQSTHRNRFVSPFAVYPLGFTEDREVFDQPGGRFGEHDPARRGHRLHAPCHPDLLADRGQPERARTDLTGDHPARIQARPRQQAPGRSEAAATPDSAAGQKNAPSVWPASSAGSKPRWSVAAGVGVWIGVDDIGQVVSTGLADAGLPSGCIRGQAIP